MVNKFKIEINNRSNSSLYPETLKIEKPQLHKIRTKKLSIPQKTNLHLQHTQRSNRKQFFHRILNLIKQSLHVRHRHYLLTLHPVQTQSSTINR